MNSKATFQEVSPNVFTIFFVNHADKRRVLDGRSWLFDNHFFGIKEFYGFTQPCRMDFKHVSLWLNLFNLPPNGMTRNCGLKIRVTIGNVEDIDVNGYGVGWGNGLCVKVRLDLTKPIAWGRKITI